MSKPQVQVKCECGRQRQLPTSCAGVSFRCGGCGRQLTVPSRSWGWRGLLWKAAAVGLLLAAGLCVTWAARGGARATSPRVPPLVADAPFGRFDRPPTSGPQEVVALLGEDREKFASAVAVIADGEWIARAAGRSVGLWQAGATAPSVRIPELAGPVRALAFSGDSKMLAIGGVYPEGPAEPGEGRPPVASIHGGWFQCWSFDKENLVAGKGVTETVEVNALAFVGTDLLAVGGAPVDRLEGGEVKERRHRLQLYGVMRSGCVHRTNLSDGTTAITALSASRDGRTLAARDAMGDVEVWNFGKEPLPKVVGWVAAALFVVGGGLCFVGGGWLWRLAVGGVFAGLIGCAGVWAWQAKRGEQYLLGKLGASPAKGLSCSADGNLVAVGDGTRVRLWRRGPWSLEELAPLEGHSEPVVSLAFSPAGPWLATLDKAGELRVTHLPTGECVRHVKGLAGQEVAMSPDGRHALISGQRLAVVRLWDVVESDATRRSLGEALARDPNDPDALEQRAAAALRAGRHREALADLDVVMAKRPSSPARWLRATAAAALAAGGGGEKTAEVHALKGDTGNVLSVAYSPDGKRIVTGRTDGMVLVWDVQGGEVIHTLTGHTGDAFGVAYSHDGKHIVSGSRDRTLTISDADTGKVVRTIPGAHTGDILCVAFSRDGKYIVSGGDDNAVKVWDAKTGQALHALQGHTDWVWSVAFSHDGSRIVSGSKDRRVKVWDAIKGNAVHTLKGHTNSVTSVAFSPDGKRIASASADSTVKLWDGQTGQAKLSLPGHTNSVFSVAFSPDGKRIASGSRDKAVKVWDAQTGQEKLFLQGHTEGVFHVAFSRDGRRILSAGQDKTLRSWDDRGAYEEVALHDLAAVIQAEPKNALAHMRRGMLLLKRKDYKEARRSLDEAFRLDPKLAAAPGEKP